MALITCPECGRKISDKAPACIGCGIPMNEIMKMLAENGKKPAYLKGMKSRFFWR